MRVSVLIALASVTVSGTALALSSSPYADQDDGRYQVVRVVGYFCRGATGPLLASEEDQLPHCESVKALPHPYALELWEEGE